MKRLLAGLLILTNIFSFAQMYDPVQWDFAQEKISDNEIELQFKAHIEKGWHLYSQYLPEGVDAYPTEFIFINADNYDLKGEMIEPKPIREPDPMFENLVLPYFKDEVVFKQNQSQISC